MTGPALPRRGVLPTVIAVAVAALVASMMWATTSSDTGRPGPWHHGARGAGMMGAVSTGAPVDDLAAAEDAAALFAGRWGLTVGEVMHFTNGYYAELLDPDGRPATEVLIDPATGAVHLEWGPAMVWNTAYGMTHPPRTSAAPRVAPEQAVRAADAWLSDHLPGRHAAEPVLFPGYYTLHILRGDAVEGMLSVHAVTGDVWYHSWHGDFTDMREAPGTSDTERSAP